MKQNERLLVYAVTGFLALILLVAVVFGRGAEAKSSLKPEGVVPSLTDLLPKNGAQPPVAGSPNGGGKGAVGGIVDPAMLGGGGVVGGSGLVGGSGVPAPSQLGTELPLMAQVKPMVAAELVAQSLGLSRRDRNVRFVRAKSGDSLETLVRRWCGARDPFFAEAQSLNEELSVLRVGQEVALPWVDDEVLAAAIETQRPRTLLDGAGTDSPSLRPEPAGRSEPVGRPDLAVRLDAMPNGSPSLGTPVVDPIQSGLDGAAGRGSDSSRAPAASTTTYVVKRGDSLWRIAERTYGRQNADRMIPKIKAANAGLGDSLREGQKIQLPKAGG